MGGKDSCLFAPSAWWVSLGVPGPCAHVVHYVIRGKEAPIRGKCGVRGLGARLCVCVCAQHS